MKTICSILLLAAAASSFASEIDTQAEADPAKQAVAAFGKALKGELMTAMQSGGPVNAISACNIKAPEIAAAVSSDHDLHIGRVSLKNRNPDNAPSAWQRTVLESFEARKQAGEDITALTWQELAEVDGGREYRFMKAIPTAPLCLQCHGAALAPQVADRLAELYPEDKATGFSEGDLRGAFVVTKKL
jgi:hypothetical protein